MKKLTKATLNHNDLGRYSYSPYCGLVKNRLSLMKNSNILLDKFVYYINTSEIPGEHLCVNMISSHVKIMLFSQVLRLPLL